jgi:lysyl-tRNA synthetase class 2
MIVGLDATHNPEFTTCEFYQPYADLDRLMCMTEDLLCSIHSALANPMANHLISLQENHASLNAYFESRKPFQKLPFLPTLMDRINRVAPDFRLPPNLSSEDAITEISLLFDKLQIALPAQVTVARLLDSLASHFIEPLCEKPTFITHYPAIMSPLAKSFLDDETGHLISARAELFINGIEYINMYEEENDPFMQAKKFLLQSTSEQFVSDISGDIDLTCPQTDVSQHQEIVRRLTPGQRYFIRVLEMGLPPTGGWGCGIERLVMLFGGAKRIADVLPFGNLRNVVAMGTEIRQIRKIPIDGTTNVRSSSSENDGSVEIQEEDHLATTIEQGRYTYV